VTSDKVLSYNRKLSGVNNRSNYFVYYRNKNIMSSLFFAITKFLDIRCVNAVRLCAISINTAYIAHHLNIFRLFIKPTCEDAGILPHWCTCSQQNVLSNTNESVIDISKQFVRKINEKLTNVSQCENLSLSEVKYASRFVTSDKVLSFSRVL
jgi:hypothetical protein